MGNPAATKPKRGNSIAWGPISGFTSSIERLSL